MHTIKETNTPFLNVYNIFTRLFLRQLRRFVGICVCVFARAGLWYISNSVKGSAGGGVVSVQIREFSPLVSCVINGDGGWGGRKR